MKIYRMSLWMGTGLLAGLLVLMILYPSLPTSLFQNQSPRNSKAVSSKEFAELMDGSARRHVKRSQRSTPPSRKPSTADTTSGKQESVEWSTRFDSEIVRLLEELQVQPILPKTKETNFSLASLGGDTRSLDDFEGNWRLVNFWATWCAPCREEMPDFTRLQGRLSDRNLVVLGVNIDEPRPRVERFVRRNNLKFTILLDRTSTVGSRYGVFTLPATWISDPEGQVVGLVRGPRNWDQDPALALFKKLTRPTGDERVVP